MTLTAVYASDLSRVRLNFSSAPAAADYALIERSTDSVNWVTVRGGSTVPINSGSGKLDDYEFEAGKANTYRASYVDSAAITFVAQGTESHGSNAPLATALPAGIAVGDLMLLVATINTGTADTPTGWLLEYNYGPITVFSRRYVTGDTAPTVTFTGGITNASNQAYIIAWRNAQPGYQAVNSLTNASAQNVALASLTGGGTYRAYFYMAWKANGAATSSSVPAGPLTTLPNAVGDGSSNFYGVVPGTNNLSALAAQTLTVVGGVAAVSRALTMSWRQADYVTRDTATITPSPGSIWLKNPSRPGLNTPVTVTGFSDITRPDRGAELDVIGRTMPVAITDVLGSRRITITITTTNLSDAADMDKRLATGEPIFLQAPDASCPIPTMYAVVKGTAQKRNSMRTKRRFFDLPLVEVAAPGSVVTGDTILYVDVTTTWATYADVLAAKATYSDLIDSISTGVVIVA
jgi:hypothetical protein